MNEVAKQRLESRILTLMAELYFRELKSPAIGFATFTKVELNKDNTVAKIYVSIMEDTDGKKATLRALRNAAGFIRGVIGRQLRLKQAPVIEFVPDLSLSVLMENPASEDTTPE